MRKKIGITKVVDEIEVICDDCGKKIEYRSHTCCMCHKDLCEVCYGTYGAGGGDYPPVYCKDCLDIGKPYIDEMNRLELAYDEKCEALSDEWRAKCVERRKGDAKAKFYPEFQDCSNH